MPEKIYSVKQVADVVGVAPTTILRRIHDRKLEAFQTNGNSGPYRVTEQALQKFQRYREQYPFGHSFPLPEEVK